MTGYEIYTQWCRDHGQEPPSKAWWDKACALEVAKEVGRAINYGSGVSTLANIRADQREIDRERREGWAYGDN